MLRPLIALLPLPLVIFIGFDCLCLSARNATDVIQNNNRCEMLF